MARGAFGEGSDVWFITSFTEALLKFLDWAEFEGRVDVMRPPFPRKEQHRPEPDFRAKMIRDIFIY